MVITLKLISDVNKTIDIKSLSSSYNSTYFSNQNISLDYLNYAVKVKTNLNEVNLDSALGGIQSLNIVSTEGIGFVIITGCIVFSMFILYRLVRRL